MPVETGLWRISDNGLTETQKSTLQSEADLHNWIEANPRLVSSDLLIIGSEVSTAHGGRIDLLGVDSAGIVHVIEIKRDRTSREVVAQVLDYASWVAYLTSEDLDKICRDYRKTDLIAAFQERFTDSLPETLNDEHSITIVASSLDAPSERIVQYLSQRHGLNINAVFFTVFEDALGKYLTRSWLIDPEEVSASSEALSEQKQQGPWTGYYFVNIGVDKDANRSWDDARKYGFVSAGNGIRFRRFMQKLQPGDKIFGYIKGHGYVGYGIVSKPAVMAKDFRLQDGERLFDQKLVGSALRNNSDDEDLSEYVVAVDWKKTVNMEDAKSQPGIFAIQQVVCKIYDAATTDFLKRQFGITE